MSFSKDHQQPGVLATWVENLITVIPCLHMERCVSITVSAINLHIAWQLQLALVHVP